MRLSFVSSLAVVVISWVVFLPFHQVEACSRIFWNSNGQAMLVARNMDLVDYPVIYVMPAGISKEGKTEDDNPARWTSKYGSVVMAFWRCADLCDEGINTQGLAFHYLFMSDTEYEERDLSRPGVDGGIFGQYLLDNAATVKEALDLMFPPQNTQLVPGLGDLFPCHVALEDATGDSAVVEFIDGEMVVYHGPAHTVLTNEPPLDQQLDNLKRYRKFGGNLPWPGDVESMDRFVRASAFLLTLNSQPFPSLHPNLISRLFSAIRAAATPFGTRASDGNSWPTIWTSLFDLTNKTIYFTDTVAKNNFWIDMGKLNFSPSAPVLYLEAYRPGLFGEVSGLFIPLPQE
ncbi:MAG: linear amide C-N hydrolase [Deltaproteobacteria bacterium]|nr:linear amide C-N hydrolase [Deltaproteobacteria bacterium]